MSYVVSCETYGSRSPPTWLRSHRFPYGRGHQSLQKELISPGPKVLCPLPSSTFNAASAQAAGREAWGGADDYLLRTQSTPLLLSQIATYQGIATPLQRRTRDDSGCRAAEANVRYALGAEANLHCNTGRTRDA